VKCCHKKGPRSLERGERGPREKKNQLRPSKDFNREKKREREKGKKNGEKGNLETIAYKRGQSARTSMEGGRLHHLKEKNQKGSLRKGKSEKLRAVEKDGSPVCGRKKTQRLRDMCAFTRVKLRWSTMSPAFLFGSLYHLHKKEKVAPGPKRRSQRPFQRGTTRLMKNPSHKLISSSSDFHAMAGQSTYENYEEGEN